MPSFGDGVLATLFVLVIRKQKLLLDEIEENNLFLPQELDFVLPIFRSFFVG